MKPSNSFACLIIDEELSLNDHRLDVAAQARAIDRIAAVAEERGMQAQIITEWAASVAEQDFKRRRRQAESKQGSLFAQDPEALDGLVAMGNGELVALHALRRSDYLNSLRLGSENVKAVTEKQERREEESAEILPYFKTSATTLREALAEWRADRKRDRQARARVKQNGAGHAPAEEHEEEEATEPANAAP